MATAPQTCAACSAPLYYRNRSGYCRAHVNGSPQVRAKLSAALRQSCRANPEMREARRRAGRASATGPDERERRSRAARERNLSAIGRAALTPEVYARIGASISATRMAWCPAPLRDQYRSLVKNKGIKAAEARSIILEQHEAEMRRWRRSIGAEPPPALPTLGGTFFERASNMAARWAKVASLWNGGRGGELSHARWAVFLALRRGGWTRNRIATVTGMDRTSVTYGLQRAEILAAAPGDFADLFRRVCAA